ncbi:MAG TPA: hypothetical protein VJ761_17280 [Ktedonobacteraceae bacterium]|nr:hypothetical protein [Ktedonobacteraceae bacterium]
MVGKQARVLTPTRAVQAPLPTSSTAPASTAIHFKKTTRVCGAYEKMRKEQGDFGD